jgi:hypothetical protein
MIYAEGNNREAVKIKRFSIPIQFETGVLNYARYYLPELPEVNKGRVVGIQAHLRLENLTQPSYITVPRTNPGSGAGTGPNWGTLYGKLSTLNLVNNEDKLVIENFPLIQLSGLNATDPNIQKIIPFDIKINSKKSYIYFFPQVAPSSTEFFYVNLTFFYVE